MARENFWRSLALPLGGASWMTSTRVILEDVVPRFRQALEQYYQLHPTISHSTNPKLPVLARFPEDHCKSASMMLGVYLIEHCGIRPERVRYVWGTRGAETHGWIQCAGLIIDITADQFDDQDRSVIIERPTNANWHSTFAGQKKYEVGLRAGHPLRLALEDVSELLSRRHLTTRSS